MTVPDLEPAARRVAALLDGVPDALLHAPTPCADTPVAGLLDHLMGLAEGLRAAAAKEPGTGTPSASAAEVAAEVAADWRTRFGPAVPVPADAPPFDRALGLSGRDPAWRPPTPTASRS